jgi:hypothetical protein
LAPNASAGKFLLALRTALRRNLQTQTFEEKENVHGLASDILPQLNRATRAAVQVGELFVGMGRGPYMLVLKAEDPTGFLIYSRHHPSHEVWISWRRDENEGRTWRIAPLHDQEAYQLSFRIPKVLGDWIFSTQNVRRAAMDIKQAFFSEITIYRHEGGRDQLTRLIFRPQQIEH